MGKNTKKTPAAGSSSGSSSKSSSSNSKSSSQPSSSSSNKKSSNSKSSQPSSSSSSSNNNNNNTTTARYERKINEKPYSSILDYIYYSNKMLELEKEAESEEASKNSKNYRYVQVEEYTMGCNGRCNVKLLFKSKNGPEFKVGESITLNSLDSNDSNNSSSNSSNNSNSNSNNNNNKNIVRGVISVSITSDKGYIIVTMDEFLDEWYESSKLVITKILDEVTFKRLNFALKHLEQSDKSPANNIVNLCFNNYINFNLNTNLDNYLPSINSNDKQVDEMEFFSTKLNDSQKDAIKNCLKSNDMHLILGPPGTGKTTTIVELIRQSVILKKMKLLVCAPSNIAVDNIVEKLSDENTSTYSTRKIKLCRVGHPARMMESILKHSIDYNISVGEGVKVIADIRKDIIRISKLITKTRGLERRQHREELRILEKELKQKEKQAIHDVIRYSDVVLCTLTGADDFYLRDKIFDMVIIDEAAQSIEIACWIALLKGKKCVLAGDHYQLPPTVLSKQAQNMGFEISLFERMYFKFTNNITSLLNVQYRMNQEIMKWSSDEFYNSKLIAHDSVKDHLLSDLLNDLDENNLSNNNNNSSSSNQIIMNDELELETPLFMIDTANCDMEEVTLDDLEESTELQTSKSKINNYEVNLVESYLKKLVNECKISEQYIGIITPYSAQVQALRSKLSEEFPFVEISTVDGFQGREKEAIIICTVRSNKNGDVGFLSEERRLNVAITRAKRHVCLISDSNTLKTNQFLSRLIIYMEQYADIRSANDYI